METVNVFMVRIRLLFSSHIILEQAWEDSMYIKKYVLREKDYEATNKVLGSIENNSTVECYNCLVEK